MGIFQRLFLAGANTILQFIVLYDLRGWVMSLYRLDRGIMPAGALFAGVAAHAIGAPATVASTGAIVIALVVIVAWKVSALVGL